MVGTALLGRAQLPVGGAKVIGDAFAAAAQRSGAEIHFSQKVQRILMRDGRAAGVQLADGAEVHAQAVVGAMDGDSSTGSCSTPRSSRRPSRKSSPLTRSPTHTLSCRWS